MRDAERANAMRAVDEHVQELSVPAHGLVERMAPGAEVAADPVRVQQSERAVVADREAGDRPASRVAVYA